MKERRRVTDERLDILCFGAHPDDVEIGMAGTILKHVDQGYRVGICDLTYAELSSNGTVALRQEEAKQAAECLKVSKRINLGFPDRGLSKSGEIIRAVVQVIRQYQPTLVFVPHEEDRHPDHGMVAKIVEEALFSAGIRKFETDNENQAHKVKHMYYYFINGFDKPQILVDISAYIEQKRAALLAYRSQFIASDEGTRTRLNTGFIEVVEGRERLFGKMIHVDYAEAFMSKEPIPMHDLHLLEVEKGR